MEVKVRHQDGVAILTLAGRFTVFDGGNIILHNAVMKELDGDEKNILLNSKGVSEIDASCVEEFANSLKTVTHRSGKLKLCCLSTIVEKELKLTGMISMFEVYDDEQKAIESFK